MRPGSSWQGQARRRDGTLVAVAVWSTEVAGLGLAASLVYVRGLGEGLVDIGTSDVPASDAKAMVAVSLEGTITGWSPAAERLYGFGADEVVGRSLAKLAPSESLDDVASMLEQIRHGERATSFHTSQLTKHGCRIDVCLDVEAVRDGTGDVASATVVVRDVIGSARSEQELRQARASARDANRALRESEERFRGAFDGASIGMALVSPDGPFLAGEPGPARHPQVRRRRAAHQSFPGDHPSGGSSTRIGNLRCN